MTPAEYNLSQYDKGLLTMAHVSRMTAFWQVAHKLNDIDGKCGPDTRKSLETIQGPCQGSTILQLAWRYASNDIGKGGDGIKNNEGVYLDDIRERTNLPMLGAGAWCAVGISNWIVLADHDLGHVVKSRSAPGLVRNLLTSGAREIEPDAMLPGEVGVAQYGRGNINSGLNHVRMVRLDSPGRWEGIGANEKGDTVNHHFQTLDQLERRLIKIVRFV